MQHARSYSYDLLLVLDLGILPIMALLHLLHAFHPTSPSARALRGEDGTHSLLSIAIPFSRVAASSSFSISASSSAKMASSSSSLSPSRFLLDSSFGSTRRDASDDILTWTEL